jgi:type II secretory pathway component PulC
MDFGVSRRVWATEMVGIVVVAGLAGHATSRLIAAAFLPHVEPLASRAPPARRPRPVPPDKPIDGIVGRNVFCSTCGGAAPIERIPPRLTLLAIMFAPPPSDGRCSVAIVRDDEAGVAGPYGVGARLGGATIVAIEQVRVVLDPGDGELEFLWLLSGAAPPPPDERHAPPRSFRDVVKKTGAHGYEIRRAALEPILTGGTLAQLARIVPETRDGQPVGLRLLGVGRDGPLAAIGLAESDVLLEVNGRSIATPGAALAAYTTFRTSSHVSLLVERAGARIRMDYAIR